MENVKLDTAERISALSGSEFPVFRFRFAILLNAVVPHTNHDVPPRRSELVAHQQQRAFRPFEEWPQTTPPRDGAQLQPQTEHCEAARDALRGEHHQRGM